MENPDLLNIKFSYSNDTVHIVINEYIQYIIVEKYWRTPNPIRTNPFNYTSYLVIILEVDEQGEHFTETIEVGISGLYRHTIGRLTTIFRLKERIIKFKYSTLAEGKFITTSRTEYF